MSAQHHVSYRRPCQKRKYSSSFFAAAKLARGNNIILEKLKLDQNEKNTTRTYSETNGN